MWVRVMLLGMRRARPLPLVVVEPVIVAPTSSTDIPAATAKVSSSRGMWTSSSPASIPHPTSTSFNGGGKINPRRTRYRTFPTPSLRASCSLSCERADAGTRADVIVTVRVDVSTVATSVISRGGGDCSTSILCVAVRARAAMLSLFPRFTAHRTPGALWTPSSTATVVYSCGGGGGDDRSITDSDDLVFFLVSFGLAHRRVVSVVVLVVVAIVVFFSPPSSILLVVRHVVVVVLDRHAECRRGKVPVVVRRAPGVPLRSVVPYFAFISIIADLHRSRSRSRRRRRKNLVHQRVEAFQTFEAFEVIENFVGGATADIFHFGVTTRCQRRHRGVVRSDVGAHARSRTVLVLFFRERENQRMRCALCSARLE